jgi:hypothetical protein
MDDEIPMGTRQVIDGQPRVYYYGYWLKAYPEPPDTLAAKKQLIEALTRRLFNHVEHGLNVPGSRLDEARRAFDSESDPQRKRIKAGMLAGALFNRAAEMFTKLVELQALGVAIHPDDALMCECGDHLQEALTLGKMVLHRSGEEGIDELWGEPFKAFAYPMADFMKTRYIKIAQAMGGIDRIAVALVDTLDGTPEFAGIAPLVHEFAGAAKAKCETLRTDPEIFDIWTTFVVAGERLVAFSPHTVVDGALGEAELGSRGVALLRAARDLITHIMRARVPMPKSTRELVERCDEYRDVSGRGPRSRVERVA